MKSFFNRHRVRSTFYHLVLIATIIVIVLNAYNIIPDKTALFITVSLIVLDWFAEMYDPHPEAPGRWFKKHFHRLWDEEENED